MAGGVQGAEAGILNFMVGAESDSDVKRAEEVLLCMGKKVVHCGGPGAG